VKTTIPVGTIVKLRHKGDFEYAKIVDLPITHHNGDDKFGVQYFVITEEEKKQAVKAVWKGTTLEQR